MRLSWGMTSVLESDYGDGCTTQNSLKASEWYTSNEWTW